MDVFNDPQTTQGTGLTPLSYWTYMQDLVNHFNKLDGTWHVGTGGQNQAPAPAPPQHGPLNCGAGIKPVPAKRLQLQLSVTVSLTSLEPRFTLWIRTTWWRVGCSLVVNVERREPTIDMCQQAQVSMCSNCRSLSSAHLFLEVTRLNGIAVRIRQAEALNKPIIAGEMGVLAGTDSRCTSLTARNDIVQAKEQAQFKAGASAVLRVGLGSRCSD